MYCTSVQQRGLWETSSKVNAMYDDRWIVSECINVPVLKVLVKSIGVLIQAHVFWFNWYFLSPSHRCLKLTEHCYILCLLHRGKCAYAHKLSYGLCKILLKEVGYFTIPQGNLRFT